MSMKLIEIIEVINNGDLIAIHGSWMYFLLDNCIYSFNVGSRQITGSIYCYVERLRKNLHRLKQLGVNYPEELNNYIV